MTCPQEGLCSRDSFVLQGQPSQDADQQRLGTFEFLSGALGSAKHFSLMWDLR
jgi:hypothetical protein